MLLRLPLISLDANLLILLNGACLIPGVPSLMPAGVPLCPSQMKHRLLFNLGLSFLMAPFFGGVV